jgi:flagellar hook-length control protein FliK
VDPAPAAAPAPATATAQPTGTAVVAGLVPVAATTLTGAPVVGTPATQASAVLDQVLPAVPRMVQRGDGTSQLTLKLHPADLGEVHLTVKVRGESVDVTVAAGPEAKAALAQGSTRLRSLLEGIGHTTGQVTFRDLAVTTTVAGGTGSGTQHDRSQAEYQGGQQSQPGSQTSAWTDGATTHQDQAPGHQPGDPSDSSGRPPAGRDGGRAAGPHHDGTAVPLRPSDGPRLRPWTAAGLDVTI